MVLMLERPTLGHQAACAHHVAVAIAVRFQGLVLLAVLATSLRPRGVLRAALPRGPESAAVCLGAAAAVLADARPGPGGAVFLTLDRSAGGPRRLRGGREGRVLVGRGMAHDEAAPGGSRADQRLRPAECIGVSCREGAGRQEHSPSERAFIAVAVAAVGWLLIQAGLFTSRLRRRRDRRALRVLRAAAAVSRTGMSGSRGFATPVGANGRRGDRCRARSSSCSP